MPTSVSSLIFLGPKRRYIERLLMCFHFQTGREFKCGHTNINRRIVSNESLTTQYITKFNLDGHVANHNMVFKNYNDIVIGYIGFQIGNILKVISAFSIWLYTNFRPLSRNFTTIINS